jgi:Fe-S-cluster-containing dehydrogenase component
MSKEGENNQDKNGLSRRKFLRNSAIAVASVPLVSLAAVAAAPQKAEALAPAATGNKIPPMEPLGRAKTLLVNRGLCNGCQLCVHACTLHHEQQVRPATSRIHVRRYYGMVDVPIICWHCADAPCVTACPVTPAKALVKNEETNIIRLNEKLCLGATCNLCIEACPAEYIRRHPDTGMPIMCDLCDGDPQCVRICDLQSRETGQIMRADAQLGGIHQSFRNITPQMAADNAMTLMFYPNRTGERI